MIHGSPRGARVVGAEHAGGRDGDEDPLLVARVEHDRVEAHPSCARLPRRPRPVLAQPRNLVPRRPGVVGAEERGVFDTGVDDIGIGQRRFEMPHPRELPRVWGPVVPLVRAGHPRVAEVVTGRLPCRSAVVRPLDELAEPRRGLGRVEPVRIRRRTLEVVHLPPAEGGAGNLPLRPLGIRRQDEGALASADQRAYTAHAQNPPRRMFRVSTVALVGLRVCPKLIAPVVRVTIVRFAWFTLPTRVRRGRGSGAGVAVGDGHLLVHRSRGFDASVGGASGGDEAGAWPATTRSCVTRSSRTAGMW